MSPESIARSDAKAAELRGEMALYELREALDITQEQLAKTLHVKQAAVSKMERRTDMYVSTLADCVKALGGTLEISASFPQGRVNITQFGDVRRYGTEYKIIRVTDKRQAAMVEKKAVVGKVIEVKASRTQRREKVHAH